MRKSTENLKVVSVFVFCINRPDLTLFYCIHEQVTFFVACLHHSMVGKPGWTTMSYIWFKYIYIYILEYAIYIIGRAHVS